MEETNEVIEKNKNVKKNYFYNLIYQIFLIIVPLVVMPYVSRVLTPDGIGKYSFSYSINVYFTSFAALGFVTYGQRIIANNQNNKIEQSKNFWEIIICRAISVAISLGLSLILSTIDVFKDYNLLLFILNLNIIAVAFDISFFFQGNEEFSKIVVRNVIIRLITIALIFILVKKKDDLWLYTLIQSGSLLLGNLSLWPYLKNRLCKVNISILKPMSHFYSTFRLFIPTIATQIYVMVDKTLIGVLINDTYTVIENGVEIIKKYSDLENGLYEQAEKIVKKIGRAHV